MICAIILAGGQGTRLRQEDDKANALPKQYQTIRHAGAVVPILRRTVDTFLLHPQVGEVVVVHRQEDTAHVEAACRGLKVHFCVGGATRQSSVRCGLRTIETLQQNQTIPPCSHVLVHDGVRPFVSPGLITRVCDALAESEAVLPTLLPFETVYYNGQPVDRSVVQMVQTPQGFAYEAFKNLHEQKCHLAFSDDSSLVFGHMRLTFVAGERQNIKITDASDLAYARFLSAGGRACRPSVGVGFDVHGFSAQGGTEFITLCGVRIPHTHRLEGHSDSDVATHALVDALLGSVAQGDIGQHFPPSEARWKGVSSLIFLEKARGILKEAGAQLQSVDITIIAQAPPLAPFYHSMSLCLASVLEIDVKAVSVKATTTEHLGFVGRKEGIAAVAVATVLLEK